MKFLSNMRIGQRLTAVFAVVIVCLMAMAGATNDRLMGEITHASAEQRTGIKRVTNTIHEMDKSTQQNAALVEEAAAAAVMLLNGKPIGDPLKDIAFYNAVLKMRLGDKPVDACRFEHADSLAAGGAQRRG